MKYRYSFVWFVLLFLMSAPAGAQEAIQPEISISAYTLTNDRGQARDNIGLGIHGGVRLFKRFHLGAEAYGDHDDPGGGQTRTRSRYFGAYRVFDYQGLTVEAGAGGGKTGNEAVGFGQLGAHYRRLSLLGRYGEQDFVEAEGAFRLAEGPHWAFSPFYRYSKIKIAGADSEQQVAGLRVTIK